MSSPLFIPYCVSLYSGKYPPVAATLRVQGLNLQSFPKTFLLRKISSGFPTYFFIFSYKFLPKLPLSPDCTNTITCIFHSTLYLFLLKPVNLSRVQYFQEPLINVSTPERHRSWSSCGVCWVFIKLVFILRGRYLGILSSPRSSVPVDWNLL